MGDRHSLAQRLLALGQVLLVQHRREFLAKLLLEGLRRVRQTLGLELGLALVLGRGLLVADVEVLLDRLAALERLLEAAEGVGACAWWFGESSGTRGAAGPWSAAAARARRRAAGPAVALGGILAEALSASPAL